MKEASLLTALAAFVIRQSDIVQQDRGLVCGVDAIPGMPGGLGVEDRRVMAHLSQMLLKLGRSDIGAEVHELLFACTQPLGSWIPLPEVVEKGLQSVSLIDADALAPTAECREIARRFGGYLPDQEAAMFDNFRAVLKKNFGTDAPRAYTAVREWVVRNPICTIAGMQQFLTKSRLVGPMIQVLMSFYEPVPLGWAAGEGVPTCGNCGNAMRRAIGDHYRCRTLACAETLPPAMTGFKPADSIQRVKRPLMTYWVNAGFDEIRLFDVARKHHKDVVLYPDQDKVDISIGKGIGIDLKAYTSPEMLAGRFNEKLGGLAAYERRIIVVPDRFKKIGSYMSRLTSNLEGAAKTCECMWWSDAAKEFGHA